MAQKMHFNKILEMIDNLSLDEQEDLINIVQHRQNERISKGAKVKNDKVFGN